MCYRLIYPKINNATMWALTHWLTRIIFNAHISNTTIGTGTCTVPYKKHARSCLSYRLHLIIHNHQTHVDLSTSSIIIYKDLIRGTQSRSCYWYDLTIGKHHPHQLWLENPISKLQSPLENSEKYETKFPHYVKSANTWISSQIPTIFNDPHLNNTIVQINFKFL